MLKMIKNAEEYSAALAELGALMMADPEPGTPDGDRLEVVALLLSDYETRTVPRTLPSPLEALRFRMEEQDLAPRDLVPYIGSRSKVSEVLSGKRPLSLPMIRALHQGLGIPAAVLLQDQEPDSFAADQVDWSKFPIKEMVKRGWFSIDEATESARDALIEFFAPVGNPRDLVAMYRKTTEYRTGRSIDPFALAAWTTRIVRRASEQQLAPYVEGSVDLEFMREVARLSLFEQGPKLAVELLAKHGIPLIVEPHLGRTRLDGAAVRWDAGGRPVIGLTVRYDRIDNFWFVLLHELAHVNLHWSPNSAGFYDDLETEATSEKETEADSLAGEALIPEAIWNHSAASRLRSAQAAEVLAKQLRIHPAIVAGRMRRHFGSYRVLTQMVGHGELRRCFPDIQWDD